MNSLTTWRRAALGIAVTLVVATGTDVWAQKTPAQRADELNTVGKQLFVKAQYRAAAEKFAQATVLSPEGRLYWNLCLTRVQLNRPRGALTACLAVEPNGAKDRVIVKARKMIAELKAKGIKPESKPTNPDGSVKAEPKHKAGTNVSANGPGTNTTGFQPNPTGQDTNVGEPEPTVKKKAKLLYDYKWALGVEFGALFSSTLGGEENYDSAGGGLRFHMDIMLNRQRGLGIQPYAHFNSIGEGVQAARLQVYDGGVGIFRHWHLKGNLYFTPLAGAHITAMQPDSGASSSVLFTLGFRAALQTSLVFGERSQYEFTVAVEANKYLSAWGQSSNLDPSSYGLDQSSSAFGLIVGLKMRFDTPFGAASIFTLE